MRRLLMLSLLFLSCSLQARVAEAIFAGGNFWRMEAIFNKIPGVLGTVSGFDGGVTANPSYEQVISGKTGYVSAVRVIYNTSVISYKNLLKTYWRYIDPTVKNAQFCDSGPQFKTVIFYLNDRQKKLAMESRQEIKKIFPEIYTEVLPSTQFYAAEGEHQNFYQKHFLRYRLYLFRCGQQSRLNELWAKSAEPEKIYN